MSLALARHRVLTRARQSGSVTMSSAQFHVFSRSSSDSDEQEQARMRALPTVRTFHSSSQVAYSNTPVVERTAVAMTLGLGALSAGAFAASSAVQAINAWQASRPEPPTEEEQAENTAKSEDAQQGEAKTEEQKKKDAGPRENIFSKWFEVRGKYYEGGFEDTMTRREAALILGVRESSNARRIKDAHRKLLILNHPDTGGSTYISGKLNEAKELLLKGKAKMK
jgi:DnaJ family protein C protein 19